MGVNVCLSISSPSVTLYGLRSHFRPSKVFFSFKPEEKVDEDLLRISEVIQELHHKVGILSKTAASRMNFNLRDAYNIVLKIKHKTERKILHFLIFH